MFLEQHELYDILGLNFKIKIERFHKSALKKIKCFKIYASIVPTHILLILPEIPTEKFILFFTFNGAIIIESHVSNFFL